MNAYLELVWLQLFSSIWFALIGLLVGIGLVFILKKRKYLEREHSLLQLLTKFYFVYFPFVFLFAFWFFGSLWTTTKHLENEANKVIIDIEEKVYPIFINYVNEGVDQFLEQESLPTNDEIVSRFIEKTLDKDASGIYRYTMNVSLTTILEYMIGKDSEREKRIRILSEGVSKDLLKVGFDFIKEEVKRKGLQILLLLLIPVVVSFLGAMFFPSVEIIVYNLFFKRKE